MLIGLSGMEQFASAKIDPEDTTTSLNQIIEKALQSKLTIHEPLILKKSKSATDLIKRLRELYNALLSEDLKVSSDQKVQFNQSFLSWLEILGQ